MVNVLPEQATGITLTVTVSKEKDPASDTFVKTAVGVRVKFPQAVVATRPWPNSTPASLLIEIAPANTDPMVGIKITVARPSAILRLRVLLFFFTTGSSSEPGFKAFISYPQFLILGSVFLAI
jgi:hypothetical protein